MPPPPTGWLNNPAYTVNDAIDRGQDVYEVLVYGWGTALPQCRQWPPEGLPGLATSVAGIAIGPRSTVDRAWLSYNLMKPRALPFIPGVTDRLRRLSVDTPLIFPQANMPNGRNQPGAQNDPVATQTISGALYVFAEQNIPGALGPLPIEFAYPVVSDTTVLPGNYTDVHGVNRIMFSDAAGAAPNTSMFPLLHLYFYLKTPINYVPPKRFPLEVQKVGTAIAAGSEKLLAQIPTFGRKYIRIMMMCSVTANFRIGALRGIQEQNGMQEQPVDQALAVPANTPTILGSCAVADFADYTNLYVTTTAPGTAIFQVTAYD